MSNNISAFTLLIILIMGAETILSTILQLLFSVFAINENDQSALFYRVYKILSIIFVSFFIYRHKYGTF